MKKKHRQVSASALAILRKIAVFFCQSKTLSRLNAEAPKLKNDGLHDMTVAYCSIVACEQVADERIMQARNRPRSHIVGDSSVSRILVSPNTLYHCQNG